MNTKLLGTIILISLASSGCGGGGGSSSDKVATVTPEPASPAPATVPQVPEPTDSENPVTAPVTAAVTATDQLQASNDFELGSNLDVDVRIDISGLTNSSGYLSICSSAEDSTPDYDNCFVRTSMATSTFDGTLQLSTALDTVHSAIWFLDMSRDPIVTRHDLENRIIEVKM